MRGKLATALFIAFTISAGAQERKDSTATAERLPVVVVTGTRTPRLLSSEPIATRLITSEEIRRSTASALPELMQSELPSLEFGYSMDQQQTLNFSGFGGQGVLFLVDGERLAGETLDNPDYSRLTLGGIDRVEIVKGTASALYGSNALGAVVNLIPKEVKEPWMTDAEVQVGSHGRRRYSLFAAASGAKISNSISAGLERSDAIRLSKVGEAQGDISSIHPFHTWNINDRLVWTPSKSLRLTARGGYFFRQRDRSVLGSDRYRNYWLGAKARFQMSKKSSVELDYNYDQYDKADYDRTSREEARTYSNRQHSARLFFSSVICEPLTLSAGADYLSDFLQSYQFTDGSSHSRSIADAFAQAEWTPLKSLTIVGALRYDYFSDSRKGHLSPKLSLLYHTADHSLRASYGGGFRSPTLKERFMSFDMAGIFMVYGTEDLKSETSNNFSLSYQYTHSYYDITISGYYNKIQNHIDTIWDSVREGQVYTNTSRLNIIGAELDLAANWPFGLAARLCYAYCHENRGKDGSVRINPTRPHSLVANLSYSHSWLRHHPTEFTLRGRAMSAVTTDYYATIDLQIRSRRVPGYTLWNLGVSQEFFDGMQLWVKADNIFNYRPSIYYNNSPITTGITLAIGCRIEIEKIVRRH